MTSANSDLGNSALNVGLDLENDEARTPVRGAHRTFSIPRELDIFGFYLSPKHALIVLLIISLMFGAMGAVVFLLALGLYTSSQNNSTQFTRRNKTRLARWNGGTNIKGMKDLPPDPRKSG